MRWSQFFTLMGAAYVGPHLHASVSFYFGVAALVMAVIALYIDN